MLTHVLGLVNLKVFTEEVKIIILVFPPYFMSSISFYKMLIPFCQGEGKKLKEPLNYFDFIYIYIYI